MKLLAMNGSSSYNREGKLIHIARNTLGIAILKGCRMHLFLTGEKQIGKSTIIDKVLAAHPLYAQGFRTGFAGRKGTTGRALCLYPVRQSRTAAQGYVVARYEGDRPIADPAAFDAFGAAQLRNVRAGWIVMDECGRLEKEAHLFRAQVFKTLDGDIPVLGVLGREAGDFAADILRHPKTKAIAVTKENRDALPALILAGFSAHRGFCVPLG